VTAGPPQRVSAFGLGSPQPRLLAERTQKARRPGRCALDGCHITVGIRIGQLPDGRWATVACVVRANRASERPASKDGPPPTQEG
jgi:hypothetical protein